MRGLNWMWLKRRKWFTSFLKMMLWITLSVSFNYRRSFKKIKTKIWNWMFDWNWMTNSFQIIFFMSSVLIPSKLLLLSVLPRYNRKGTLSRYPSLLEGKAGVQYRVPRFPARFASIGGRSPLGGIVKIVVFR